MNGISLRNRRRIYCKTKEARSRGECVFRDDNNREMILDIIDDYLDIVDVLQINQERSN